MSETPIFKKFHPATLKDLAGWSTLSRNEIRPFLARFGVTALGRRYPMIRLYAAVLGMTPADEMEEEILGAGLIRTSRAAERVGMSVEALHAELRRKTTTYPPLFVFGPQRHLMLRAQLEQMLASPRNAWHAIEMAADHARPASRLARELGVSQARIDALLGDKSNLPAHVITRGKTLFMLSDVQTRLANNPGAPASICELPQPPAPLEVSSRTIQPPGLGDGLFARAAQKGTGPGPSAQKCTQSAASARRGDRGHGASAEAKLTDT